VTPGGSRDDGNAPPAVELDGVSVSMGNVSVLSDVSLSVERGTFLGVIGPNGAGKTTLLRTVNGILDPDAGAVTVAGEPVHALSSKAASRLVATVPQDTSLAFDFRVRDVIEMGRYPHRDRLGRERAGDDPGRTEDADPVAAAMAHADVARFADRPVTEVSGGERQRVLLARALAQDAPLLLCDEPTASLDVNHGLCSLELVADLRDRGKTVVAAIHDLDLAARYCDELALLSDGEIVARGQPEAVLESGALGDAFDTSIVRSRDRVTGAPSVTALPDPAPDRDATVHVVAGNGSGAGVLSALVAAGFEVSVGVLREGDPDAEVATQLGCEGVSVPPYTPIEAAIGAAGEHAREADAALLADVAIGPENAANLDVLAESESPVLIETREFADRNYAGPSARERYGALYERGRVTDEEHVIEAVEAACATEPRGERGDGAREEALHGSADAVDVTADPRSR